MLKASKFNLKVAEHNGKVCLYNTCSGALSWISHQAYQLLNQPVNDHQAQQDPRMQGLMRRGFCVPEDRDESAAYFAQYQRFLNIEPESVCVTVAVTLSCNYRCRYCFENDVLSWEVPKDSPEALCAFIEKAASSLSRCKTIMLTWFGGEPLLNFDYILTSSRWLFAFCQENGIRLRTRVITNGSLLTEEMLHNLKQFGLDMIHITLDGTKEIYCTYKGAAPEDYDSVISLISRHCTDTVFNLRLNCYPANLESLMELAESLYRIPQVREHVALYLAPVESDTVETFLPLDYANAHIRFTEHLYNLGWYSQVRNAMVSRRSSPCDLLKPEGFIADYAGNFYACENHIGRVSSRIATFHDDMAYIQAQKKTQLCAYDRSLTERCKNCAYFPLCFSGCPMYRRSDSQCATFQKMVLGILEINSRISG